MASDTDSDVMRQVVEWRLVLVADHEEERPPIEERPFLIPARAGNSL